MLHNATAIPARNTVERDVQYFLRESSGSMWADSPLTSLLYLLARDHLPIGKIQEVLFEALSDGRLALSGQAQNPDQPSIAFTNGWLAQWAKHHAEALLELEDKLR